MQLRGASAPPVARPVDGVRSTLIASSLLALRDLALEAAYFRHLAPAHHAAMRSLGVGEWLDVELAAAHYAAYDAMDLDDAQVASICASAAQRTHGTMLRTMGALVRQVGGLSAPLLARKLPGVWERSFRGGSLGIEELGPRELRVRHGGLRPIGGSPYFRAALGQHYAFGLKLFAKKADVRVLSSTADLLALRLTWQ